MTLRPIPYCETPRFRSLPHELKGEAQDGDGTFFDEVDAAIVGTEVVTVKVVTVRGLRDRASEMFRSDDVVLVTRDGKPAGFYISWDQPDLPVELKRDLFVQLGEIVRAEREAAGVTEDEILADFAEWRAARRRRR